MYVLRRHTRRLLLPPGWVALGFLLLLGCQLLLAHRRQLLLPNVIQLTMPMLKPDTTGLADARRNKMPFPDFSYSGQRLAVESDRNRRWYNFNLTGSYSTDSIAIKKILVAIKSIQVDTSHARGVRIYFQQRVAYSNLVRVLDIMTSTNQKIYWFDIYNKPATFYAYTVVKKPFITSVEPLFICGTSSYIENYPILPEEPNFWQRLPKLWQKAWQPSVLLFAVIAGLSFYRLSRPRPSLR